MKLSTLIFDTSGNSNLSDLIKMAEKADNLGYTRFWLGEHYNVKNLWNNPEPLIPVLLGLTEKISVGCAGILVKLHSSLRVASSFKLINTMYPHRVDLGLAGGQTNSAIGEYFPKHDIDNKNLYSQLIGQIVSFINEEDNDLRKGVFANPINVYKPNLWLLSTSFQRFDLAIKYGLNYSRSLFHINSNFKVVKEEIQKFKDDFYKKNQFLPIINIAFSGILTKSDDDTRKMEKRLTETSKFNFIKPNIVGTIEEFVDVISEYKVTFGVEDLTFLDLSYSMEQRIDNLFALSESFDIKN